MKIAVSAAGTELNAGVDPRFGRCPYFIIVNTDDMSFEVFENENIALGGGAGIQAAQFIAAKGVKAVITGNCGPNAMKTLNAAGVQVIVGQSGPVKHVVETFKRGTLSSTSTSNVSDHFGQGGISEASASQPPRPGRGMGRGSEPERLDRERELESLRRQVIEMKRQMEIIETRIRGLEGQRSRTFETDSAHS